MYKALQPKYKKKTMAERINRWWMTILSAVVLMALAISCEPLATGFDQEEDATLREKAAPVAYEFHDSSLLVMTWNIRFGIGRSAWFGDACGDNTVFSQEEVLPHLDAIVQQINTVKPDILLLQECDVNSKRTSYLDELQYILDHTYFNYAAYAPEWKAEFIPSDGLGRMDMGQVILSPWPVTDARRVNLATRGDQSGLVNYFYLHSCLLTARIKVPGFKEFSLLNIHASAFATDDTKKKHYEEFVDALDEIQASGGYFVAGGDLNTLPPGSDSTDFCFEDMCPGESFHQPGDDPLHKAGSDYTPEKEWLLPLYSKYIPAVALEKYLGNQEVHFTHTTRPGHFWDRTLDYLFTNNRWVAGSDSTYQSALELSDHAAVGARFVLIKE